MMTLNIFVSTTLTSTSQVLNCVRSKASAKSYSNGTPEPLDPSK
jgi:hypothetical protein